MRAEEAMGPQKLTVKRLAARGTCKLQRCRSAARWEVAARGWSGRRSGGEGAEPLRLRRNPLLCSLRDSAPQLFVAVARLNGCTVQLQPLTTQSPLGGR
jgi:hypothetical protein